MRPKNIALLGATGSIGASTLRVIRANPDRLRLVGIAGNSQSLRLAEIAKEFKVSVAAIFDPLAYRQAKRDNLFEHSVTLGSGIEGLNEVATHPDVDTVVVAIVGTMGLEPSLAAIAAGKEIALASKEVMVMAGKFVTAATQQFNSRILPIDSEHNAIFQCLDGKKSSEVARIILTASGGPFRNFTRDQMKSIRPADATKHPNWSMGTKITVDSSTMANKGLELIEAKWLFGDAAKRIEVVIHPQSIVHSLVEFVDGSIIAQLSPPSMTFAIQNALIYPHRAPGVDESLDFAQTWGLEFHPPDHDRFPCLRLAREAMEAEGIAPTVFNAVNEVAVSAFLRGSIKYLEIAEIIEESLQKTRNLDPANLDDVIAADSAARSLGKELVLSFSSD